MTMSAALYIVLEDNDPGFETAVNGKALSDEEDALNKIAWDLNVTPLLEFFSGDTEEEVERMEYEGDPPKAEIPETQWFEPAEGLKTVKALLGYISEHPKAVANPTSVVSELTEFEDVLVQAHEYGLLWHLSVDY